MTNPEIRTPIQNERLWATLSHLSILMPPLSLIDLSFIVPFIIWVTQKDKSQYIAFQSFQALIYQVCRSTASLIGYGCLMASVFIFNTRALLPAGSANLIVSFSFTIYGVIGAIMAFQGKPFRYWIIGSKVEPIMPASKERRLLIYAVLLGIIIACVLILFGVFILAAIGQANAYKGFLRDQTAQHSVHPTGGSRRVFRQFA